MTPREFVLRKVTMHHDSERNLGGKSRASRSYLNSECSFYHPTQAAWLFENSRFSLHKLHGHNDAGGQAF
jgi:hypothetical protein